MGILGGMAEEKDSFTLAEVRETWALSHHEVLESGPIRAKLWTRWQGAHSWVDFTFSLSEAPWLHVDGRLLWNERSARLKLVLPCRGELEYDVPGGRIVREAEGHVPGGRWVTRISGKNTLGFASDVLSDFDATPTELRVTLARATRYANDVKVQASQRIWEPATDCGELRFQFRVFGENVVPDDVSDTLLFPPVVTTTPAGSGPWKRKGSLASALPLSVRLLSLEQVSPHFLRIRLQNRDSKPTTPLLRLGKKRIRLKLLEPQVIATFYMERRGKVSGLFLLIGN
jgi:alpha-mannosidase